MTSRAFVLSGVLLAAAIPAAAQSPGTFEIGGFGRYTKYDDTLSFEDKAGGGGTLGIFVIRNLAIEAEGAYTKTSRPGLADVENTPIRGRLTYHIPLGGYASAIRIGAGYVHDRYAKDADFSEDGVTGLVGLRVGLGEKFALQVDGTIDYGPSPDDFPDAPDNYSNFGVQGGAVLLFGNSYDKDKDGLKDNVDRCPGTPTGESVDASGCSASQRDTDSDSVKDSADRCANTPAGAKVDAEGCSEGQKDKDNDGLIDNLDKCPGTPAGEQVDAQGCGASQRDEDADGVKDNVDKCPATPAGAQVDADGCAPDQRDADADGVTDNLDQCANTPAGQPVDARGCSRDSDADGVPDGVDKCPGTPNGQAVDETGCPKLFEGATKTVILHGRDLRDRQDGAQRGGQGDPGRCRAAAGGKSRSPGASHRSHRQHRIAGDQHAAVQGPRAVGREVPRGERCLARPGHLRGSGTRQADRVQQDGRGPRPEPQGGAQPDQLGATDARYG